MIIASWPRLTRPEQHKLDLAIACPQCRAKKGRPCKDKKLPPKTVHFARRLEVLLRLMKK